MIFRDVNGKLSSKRIILFISMAVFLFMVGFEAYSGMGVFSPELIGIVADLVKWALGFTALEHVTRPFRGRFGRTGPDDY